MRARNRCLQQKSPLLRHKAEKETIDRELARVTQVQASTLLQGGCRERTWLCWCEGPRKRHWSSRRQWKEGGGRCFFCACVCEESVHSALFPSSTSIHLPSSVLPSVCCAVTSNRESKRRQLPRDNSRGSRFSNCYFATTETRADTSPSTSYSTSPFSPNPSLSLSCNQAPPHRARNH